MGGHTIESIEILNRILEEDIVETVNHRLLASLAANYLDVDLLNNRWCMHASVDTHIFEPEREIENESENIKTSNQTASDISKMPTRPLPKPPIISLPAENIKTSNQTASDISKMPTRPLPRPLPKPPIISLAAEDIPKRRSTISIGSQDLGDTFSENKKRSEKCTPTPLRRSSEYASPPPALPPKPQKPVSEPAEPVPVRLHAPSENRSLGNKVKAFPRRNYHDHTPRGTPTKTEPPLAEHEPIYAVIKPRVPSNSISNTRAEIPTRYASEVEAKNLRPAVDRDEHISGPPKNHQAISKQLHEEVTWRLHAKQLLAPFPYTETTEESKNIVENNLRKRESLEVLPRGSPVSWLETPDESPRGQQSSTNSPTAVYYSPVWEPSSVTHGTTYHAPNEDALVSDSGQEKNYDTPDMTYQTPDEEVDFDSDQKGNYDAPGKTNQAPNGNMVCDPGQWEYYDTHKNTFRDSAEMIDYDPIEYWNKVSTASDPCSWLDEEPLYQLTEAYENLQRQGSTAHIYKRCDLYSFIPSIKEQNQIHSHQAKGRTLWCQAGTVIGANVLDGLSRREKDVYEAKFEIYTTEVSFLKSLKILKKHYIKSRKFSNEKILSKRDNAELFMYIKPLMARSKAFLRDLDDCWKKSIFMHGIFDIICEHACKNFGIYITYCSYLNDTIEKLNALCGVKSFSKTLRELENGDECSKLSLLSFLTLPMERITSMDLLIKKVLSPLVKEDKTLGTHEYDTEYDSCLLASDYVRKVCEKSNEACRTKRRIKNLMQLDTKLTYPGNVCQLSLISVNRWLVMYGDVEKHDLTPGSRLKKPNAIVRSLSSVSHFSEPCTIFLFNDNVVLAKKIKRDGSNLSVVDYCPRHQTKIMLPSDMRKKHGMQKTNAKDLMDSNKQYKMILVMNENHEKKKVEMMLSCSLASERDHWVKSIPEQQKKEITPAHMPMTYVCIYPFSSDEENELSLVKGDEVTVTKRLGDGWLEGTRLRDMQTGTFPPSRVKVAPSPNQNDANGMYCEVFIL